MASKDFVVFEIPTWVVGVEEKRLYSVALMEKQRSVEKSLLEAGK